MLVSYIIQDRSTPGQKQPRIPTEFLIATQMYMDVFDALQGQMERGILECSRTLNHHGEISTDFQDWVDEDYSCLYINLHVKLLHTWKSFEG